METARPPEQDTQTQLLLTEQALKNGSFAHLRSILNALPGADVAQLLQACPLPNRRLLWQLLDTEKSSETLQELHEDVRVSLLENMSPGTLAILTEGLETDDVADILQELPDAVINQVLQNMSTQDRQRLESVLQYPKDTAGGLMSTDAVTVRASHTVEVVLRYLRSHQKLPGMTDKIIVVDREDRYLGMLPLNKLLVSSPAAKVRDLMLQEPPAIAADMPAVEVAQLFERHDWVSAPVVDEQGKLLGRITIDDVVDVIRDKADHSLLGMAGLDEKDDTFAPVFTTLYQRILWLAVNLTTVVFASAAISLFEDALDKVVALAILMPIVASMGGVAGMQTLTLMIRGMALGQIGSANTRWLLNRELQVAVVNGLLFALVIGALAGWWFQDPRLSLIIGLAMVINLFAAALGGALLPQLLRRWGIDPAVAGGVALTTITDIIGFVSFLGLASWFYA